MWEWLDTYALIVKKKNVSFLQLWHHATAFAVFWVGLQTNQGAWIAWINSLVHTVMYLHFASPRRWARIWITRLQLLQLAVGLVLAAWPLVDAACMPRPEHKINHLLSAGVIASYFLLFCNFYVQQYLRKRVGGAGGAKAKAH